MRKLTNKIIDKRLKGRSIIRLTEYMGNKIKTCFQCLICNYGKNYEWCIVPDGIINNRGGCPKCADNLQLTNEIVDQRLPKNIKRLCDYKGIGISINFLCLEEDCGYGANMEWKTSPNHIINGDQGCPNCYGNVKLTNNDIDNRLIGKDIKRLDDYINLDKHIHFQCLKCLYGSKYEWKVMPNNILNHNKGCPICNVGKNQHIVFDILKENNIVFEAEKYLKDIHSIDKKIHIDFYLPQHNTIIEYNGEQHYEPVRFHGCLEEDAINRFDEYQQPRDAFVRSFCEYHNINLIVIDGRKYANEKLKNHIMNDIIPLIKYYT
jgi:hypothetical protein